MPLSQMTPEWWGAGSPSDAGVTVTPETALAASAVYACINVIANAIGTLPVHVLRQADSTRDDSHPVARLLRSQPNPHMTPAAFRKAMMVNLLLHGNAYAFIEGERQALYPLQSRQVRPDATKGPLVYKATINGKSFEFQPDEILHLANFSIDGIVGLSPLQCASNPIGLAIAMERFGAKFFSNGAHMGGFIELPPGMKEEAVKAWIASYRKEYAGGDNAFKTGVLTDGMKYTQTGTAPEKAQMLESRVFQVREIARIYRVPLHMIGDLERATFSNIEHQGIEFQQQTILPWAVTWEQECSRKLFTPPEAETLELKFNLDALLRASTIERYAAYTAGRDGGWLSVNDIRRKEGLPPVDGGDVFTRPAAPQPTGA